MDIGSLRHRVTLDSPGGTVPDGDGGWTQAWAPLNPSQVWASITPATARDLERVTAATVISSASYIVRMRYHPQVTTQTRLTFKGRTLSVIGVANTEERNAELVLVCVEMVT